MTDIQLADYLVEQMGWIRCGYTEPYLYDQNPIAVKPVTEPTMTKPRIKLRLSCFTLTIGPMSVVVFCSLHNRGPLTKFKTKEITEVGASIIFSIAALRVLKPKKILDKKKNLILQ